MAATCAYDVPAHVLFDGGFLSIHDLIAARSTCSSWLRDTSYVQQMTLQRIVACPVADNNSKAWLRCALFVLRNKCPTEKQHVIQEVFRAYSVGLDDDRQVARHVLDVLTGVERFKTLDPYWTLMYYMHYTHDGVCTVEPLVNAMMEGRLELPCDDHHRRRLVDMLDLFRFAISQTSAIDRARIHPLWTWPIYRGIQSMLECDPGKQFFRVALLRSNGLLMTNLALKIRLALESQYAANTPAFMTMLLSISASFAAL